jgi:hypothetical protein
MQGSRSNTGRVPWPMLASDTVQNGSTSRSPSSSTSAISSAPGPVRHDPRRFHARQSPYPEPQSMLELIRQKAALAFRQVLHGTRTQLSKCLLTRDYPDGSEMIADTPAPANAGSPQGQTPDLIEITSRPKSNEDVCSGSSGAFTTYIASRTLGSDIYDIVEQEEGTKPTAKEEEPKAWNECQASVIGRNPVTSVEVEPTHRRAIEGLCFVYTSTGGTVELLLVHYEFANLHTGNCPRGAGCAHVHDPTRVTLCRSVEQGRRCPRIQECTFSHMPTPE